MTLRRNSQLIRTLIHQDLISRHKGSLLGNVWNWFLPLVMLSVYALVFSKILRMKWPDSKGGSGLEFTAILFAGLIVVNLFAEVVGRSTTLIATNGNLIKKISVPPTLLPVSLVGVALFNTAIALFFLLCLVIMSGISPSPAWLMIPIILLTVGLLALGVAWIVSALAAYIKDVAPIVQSALAAMVFLPPVFYPLKAVPTDWQSIILLNPLTRPVEALRTVVVGGKWPNSEDVLIPLMVAFVVCAIGYAVFNQLKEGFSDVV